MLYRMAWQGGYITFILRPFMKIKFLAIAAFASLFSGNASAGTFIDATFPIVSYSAPPPVYYAPVNCGRGTYYNSYRGTCESVNYGTPHQWSGVVRHRPPVFTINYWEPRPHHGNRHRNNGWRSHHGGKWCNERRWR